MKLIACSLLILSGALCVGLTSVSNNYSDIHTFGEGAGVLLILFGAALFLVEYVRSWSVTSAEKALAVARIEEARTPPGHFEPPEFIS